MGEVEIDARLRALETKLERHLGQADAFWSARHAQDVEDERRMRSVEVELSETRASVRLLAQRMLFIATGGGVAAASAFQGVTKLFEMWSGP